MSDFGKDIKSEEVCKINTSNQKQNKTPTLKSNSKFSPQPITNANKTQPKTNAKVNKISQNKQETNVTASLKEQSKNTSKTIQYNNNQIKTTQSLKPKILSRTAKISNVTNQKQQKHTQSISSTNKKQINKSLNFNSYLNSSMSSNIKTNSNTSIKTQKFPLKTILYITISIILFLATLTGCLFGILPNKSEAIRNQDITATNQIGGGADLFNSTNTLNAAVFNDLLAKTSVGKDKQLGWGSNEFCTAPRPEGVSNYVIKINDLWWQVVYRSGDYVTLWLADGYGTGTYQFDSSGTYHDYAGTASTIIIRNTLNGTIYNGLFGSYATLASSIIATPRNLYDAGIRWQSTQTETAWWSSGYKTTNSGLGNGVEGTAAYDKLWLPSGPELFSGINTYPGLWGLTKEELMFDTTTSRCWLRSGFSGNSYLACLLHSGGTQNYGNVNSGNGVRPALHMALPNMASLASGYNLTFAGANTSQFPSTEYKYTNDMNELNVTLKPLGNGNNTITSITDNFGKSITLNGSGSNTNYNYVSTLNMDTGVVTIKFTNIINNVEFSVNTVNTLNITNNSSANIIDVGAYRVSTTAANATLYAEYKNGLIPYITISSGTIEMTNTAGSSTLGSISYDFTFVNSLMTLNLSGLPNGVYNVTLDIIPATYYRVNVTANNAEIATTYDNKGNAEVVVRPQSGYWVNNFVIDGQTYHIEYFDKSMYDIANVFTLTYQARENTNVFRMHFQKLSANITLAINTSTVQPTNLKESGGAQISGVAVNTTLGGDAKIVANDLNNTDGGYVKLIAWVNAGYSFVGWSTDGGSTYLVDSSGNRYGASATILGEIVKGKVVTACFTQNSNGNINTDLNDNKPYI